MIPEKEAMQLATAAPDSEKPMPCNRKVPKNETAIIPLKLTVTFKNMQIISAFREALKFDVIVLEDQSLFGNYRLQCRRLFGTFVVMILLG